MTNTPGPWEAHSSIYEHMVAEVRAVIPGDERGIAQVWSHHNGFADARLMAAAPDMLAALEQAIKALVTPNGDDLATPAVMNAITNAIAKATGAA